MLVIDVKNHDDTPVTLNQLLQESTFLGEPGDEIAKFLNYICLVSNPVTPYMGEEEFGVYEGQPIVWDGCWEWRKDANPENIYGGNMYYCGNEGPHGYGKQVERLVQLYDEIVFV